MARTHHCYWPQKCMCTEIASNTRCSPNWNNVERKSFVPNQSNGAQFHRKRSDRGPLVGERQITNEYNFDANFWVCCQPKEFAKLSIAYFDWRLVSIRRQQQAIHYVLEYARLSNNNHAPHILSTANIRRRYWCKQQVISKISILRRWDGSESTNQSSERVSNRQSEPKNECSKRIPHCMLKLFVRIYFYKLIGKLFHCWNWKWKSKAKKERKTITIEMNSE